MNVILSEAKDLLEAQEILRFAQDDIRAPRPALAFPSSPRAPILARLASNGSACDVRFPRSTHIPRDTRCRGIDAGSAAGSRSSPREPKAEKGRAATVHGARRDGERRPRDARARRTDWLQ